MTVVTINSSDLNSICGLLYICTAVSIASRAFLTSSLATEPKRLLCFAIVQGFYRNLPIARYRHHVSRHRTRMVDDWLSGRPGHSRVGLLREARVLFVVRRYFLFTIIFRSWSPLRSRQISTSRSFSKRSEEH